MILNPFSQSGNNNYTAINITSDTSTTYNIPTDTKFILFVGPGWITGFSYLNSNSGSIAFYMSGNNDLGSINGYTFTSTRRAMYACTAFCFK